MSPISLINVNAKILAKVLARRLNLIIPTIIVPDQTGFIPGRFKAINLHRLFTNLQVPSEGPDSRIVVSLDMHKAFDSIDFPYLIAILRQLGFVNTFITLVKLLYTHPTAHLRVHNYITDTIPSTVYTGLSGRLDS